MKRERGFTLTEATISILILSVVMIVALTLLVSMRSFAAKQQSFTVPRQTARSAVDYLSYYLAGAADLNVEIDAEQNPSAVIMVTSFGNDTAVTARRASFNNLSAGQAAAGFGDEGTDIISIAFPTNPIRIPIVAWSPADATSTTMALDFTAGCAVNDAENLRLFKVATGMYNDGTKDRSPLLIVQDFQGRWRYVQITDYDPSTCSAMGGTDEVIHVRIAAATVDQIHPPDGWRSDLIAPFTLNAGIDFTSFRVRNRNLEQKTSGVESTTGRYTPGIFDPNCDGAAAGSAVAAGCTSIRFTPVVENVEDLQVAYVFRDGSVWNRAGNPLASTTVGGQASSVPGQGLTGSAPAVTATDIANVMAVRVSVITRSNPMDIGSRGLSLDVTSGRFRRPALEDRTEGPPDTVASGVFDRFRLTTTIVLRNRLLGY